MTKNPALGPERTAGLTGDQRPDRGDDRAARRNRVERIDPTGQPLPAQPGKAHGQGQHRRAQRAFLGTAPSVFSICKADQFSAAFSVMKAIRTIPPPITGTRPSGRADPSLGLRKPSIRPVTFQRHQRAQKPDPRHRAHHPVR